MEKKYSQILWWLTVATFLVPLIVIPGSFIFPFIVPKALAFRTLVLCQLGVFLSAYFAHSSGVKIKLTGVSYAVLGFGISFALSTFLGTDIHHSFWDNHERMLGLFTVLHYVIYFFILSNTFTTKENWHKLLTVFLGAGSLVMFLAVLQKIDPNFLLNNGNERVSATLGNAIYLGAYGLFLFFSGIYLYTQNKKWWNLVGSSLGLIGIMISGTRGSVLGLLAGLGAMIVVYFFTLPKEQIKIRQWLGYVALGLTALAGLLFVFRQTPMVRAIPAVGSLLNTTLSGTASTRIMAWKIAIEAWQEKPVVGWGPNNFFYAFNEHYNPDFLKHGWGETWFDNAHNIILNTLATQGVLGVASYLSLFVVAGYLLIRAVKQGMISYHLAAIGIAFLAAHLVQNAFVFENITSYLYFFFFLAMVSALTIKHKSEVVTARPVLGTGLKVGLWTVTGLLIFTTNVNPGRANMSMIDTLQVIYQGGNVAASYQKTVDLGSPHQADNRLDFGRVITQAAEVYRQNNRQTQYQSLVKLAVEELDKNRAEHPYDIRNHVQEAQLLQVSFEMFRNTDHLLKAGEILTEAKAKSPDRQQIDYMLSGIELTLGEKNKAIARLQASVDRSPDIAEGWWRLIFTMQASGDVAAAKAKAQEARAKGIVFDATGENIVAPLAPKPSST